MTQPSVSVVIPVYNSEQSLRELAEQLVPILESFTARSEIIFVDDGSRDGSWGQLCALESEYEPVRLLAMSRNYGQHNALLAGINAASCEVIVTMDDDLQHRPTDVPVLVSALGSEIDLVYGVSTEEEHTIWRNVSSRATKAAMRSTLGWDDADKTGAFRAFRSRLREGFSTRDPYVSIDVLLSWTTTRVLFVDVVMDKRKYGESNYTFLQLLRYAVNTMTGYSTAPLRLVSFLGIGAAVFGLFSLAWILGRYALQGGTVPGFAFVGSLVAIFGGTQLLALGIMGEYLGRIHFRTMGKPAYLVREVDPIARPASDIDPVTTLTDERGVGSTAKEGEADEHG